MISVVKTLKEMGLADLEISKLGEWDALGVMSEECISYVVYHSGARLAVLVDPKLEDREKCVEISRRLEGYTWVAVVDTHTHADHVSVAADMAAVLKAPLIMHQLSPSSRVHLRVCHQTVIPTEVGELSLIPTPGHTPDSLTVTWGPFILSGDTVVFNDVGRDDLPGGSPESHYESLMALKKILPASSLLLPGHGRTAMVATWGSQLKTNRSLTQEKDEFIREAAEFNAPAPKDFKRSLVENFK